MPYHFGHAHTAGIFCYFFRWMGWQEPGKHHLGNVFSLCVSHCHFVNYVSLSLTVFSAGYHRFGCRWEPIWCCFRWNYVSDANLSIHVSIGALLILCVTMCLIYFLRQFSTGSHIKHVMLLHILFCHKIYKKKIQLLYNIVVS